MADDLVEQESNIDLFRYLRYSAELIVDGHPMGGRQFGRCKIGVEWKDGFGYRTVRTTERSNGGWNKPKFSPYDHRPIVPAFDICDVLSGLRGPAVIGEISTDMSCRRFCNGDRFIGWVKICEDGIRLYNTVRDSIHIVSANISYVDRYGSSEYDDDIIDGSFLLDYVRLVVLGGIEVSV